MTRPSIETSTKNKTRDPDLAAAEIAMRRAAQKARERARRVGAGAIVWKDDRIIEERSDNALPKSLTGN